MSKKSAKSAKSGKSRSAPKTRPQPEASQLRAVERLLEAGDAAGAVQRLRPLVARFPGHGGLRRLLVEALHETGDEAAAAVAAFDWAERRPNSLPAQQALLAHAVRGVYLFLADRTAARIRALGGETRGFPLPEATKAEFASLPEGGHADEAAMIRLDITRLHMQGQCFDEALVWLEGLEFTSACNNRGSVLFYLNRIDEALAVFDGCWQRDPDNLYALAWLSSIRLYRGDRAMSEDLAERMVAATPRRADDALPPLVTLLLLDRPDAALAFYERTTGTDWWEGIDDPTRAQVAHAAGCAIARLGRHEEARALWQAVEDRFPGLTLAAENLAGSRDNPAAAWPALLQPRMALPPVLLNRFRDEPHGMEQVMDALEVADEYLEAVYLCGTDPLRRLIVVLLSYRCKAHQDPAAADLLRRFARLPIGTDDLRMSMLTSLRASGLAAGDEYLDYWHGSRLTQARGLGIEVHREPEPTGLSPDLERMFQDAFAAFADGRNEEAEQGLRAILTRAPAQPAVLANLGGILDVAGRRREAKALLRQALDVDPDYLFARCTLARLLIDEGDVAGAEALLPEIDAFERLHVQHLIALFGTTALLHAARGDAEAARGLLDVVQSVVADDDERRRLAHYQLTAGRLARDPSFMTELIKEHVSRGSGSGIQ